MADANRVPLITSVRSVAKIPTDEVFEGVAYWDDDQLETIFVEVGEFKSLPAYARDVNHEKYFVGSKSIRFELGSVVLDGAGNTLITLDATNYDTATGQITYTGSSIPYRVEGIAYNRNKLIALSYWHRAQLRSNYVNTKSAGVSLNMEAEYNHFMAMYQIFNNKVAGRLGH